MDVYFEAFRDRDNRIHINTIQNREFAFSAHFHSNIEIIYVKQGSIEVSISGEKRLLPRDSVAVADDKIVERMSGRRICSKCGASYHVVYNAPKTADVCDACGASLYTRVDDAAETVLNRLTTYHAVTEPLKDFYAAKGLLVCVEGCEKVEDTTAAVMSALSKFEA